MKTRTRETPQRLADIRTRREEGSASNGQARVLGEGELDQVSAGGGKKGGTPEFHQ